MSTDFVRRLPLFEGLAPDDLQRLLDMADPVQLQAGQPLMKEGETGDSLYVVLDGEFEISKRSGEQDLVIAVRGRGEVLGEMSLLNRAPHSASVRALRQSDLLRISRDAFEKLLASSAAAALAMLHTVSGRLQHTEAMLRQSEKMASLGTLAAGLAHELNNPAAAARRSSEHLHRAVDDWILRTEELLAQPLAGAERAALLDRAKASASDYPPAAALDPLARSDREEELQTWLEGSGIAESWELAPALVEAGWDRTRLQAMVEGLPPEPAAALLRWAAGAHAVAALLREVSQSSERISEIVRAVKAYSYLDQAPVQEVDVHRGLEDTLVILRHKLGSGVTVRRDYASDLPRIEAYASELNQVWTNLLDNAIDAMAGQGEIGLRTRAEEGRIVVEVTDNGPGIPEAIQARIFEPFFTTKPPGVGTGLGLHISYNIIVQKHQGQIRVFSRPGETRFQVSLPVRRRRAAP